MPTWEPEFLSPNFIELIINTRCTQLMPDRTNMKGFFNKMPLLSPNYQVTSRALSILALLAEHPHGSSVPTLYILTLWADENQNLVNWIRLKLESLAGYWRVVMECNLPPDLGARGNSRFFLFLKAKSYHRWVLDRTRPEAIFGPKWPSLGRVDWYGSQPLRLGWGRDGRLLMNATFLFWRVGMICGLVETVSLCKTWKPISNIAVKPNRIDAWIFECYILLDGVSSSHKIYSCGLYSLCLIQV